jgi:hypothetical protein
LGKEALGKFGIQPGHNHMPSNSLEWTQVAAMGLTSPGNYEKLQMLVPPEVGQLGKITTLGEQPECIGFDISEDYVKLPGDSPPLQLKLNEVGSPKAKESSEPSNPPLAAPCEPPLSANGESAGPKVAGQPSPDPEEEPTRLDRDESESSDSEPDDRIPPPASNLLTEEVAEELLSEQWFHQPASKTVHFYEVLGRNQNPIPRCRSNAFDKPEHRKETGVQQVIGTGLKICKICMRKISPEATAYLMAQL